MSDWKVETYISSFVVEKFVVMVKNKGMQIQCEIYAFILSIFCEYEKYLFHGTFSFFSRYMFFDIYFTVLNYFTVIPLISR